MYIKIYKIKVYNKLMERTTDDIVHDDQFTTKIDTISPYQVFDDFWEIM